jgi:beta-glucosidase
MKLLASLLAVVVFTPAYAAGDARARAESQARALVEQLTLDEKVAQLLNVAPPIERLGIPGYHWWTESLHGAWGPLPTTNFPEPIGLAATFDDALVHEVAGAISAEVRGMHALARKLGKGPRIGGGLDTWSPNINIFRDPRWGRGQETYGEDPFLTARMGVAYVRGMQGDDPDHPAVIATPKHFAVHSGPESTRHQANVFVSAHDLEDTYLPAFRAAIVDGQAGSIMCAYNRVDGQPACASDLLLKDHLRGAWQFRGYVVSDCDAVKDIADHHKYAPDAATAAAAALKAGVDNECNGLTLFDLDGIGNRYKDAYERGLVSMGDIDQALVRLFTARYLNGDLPGAVVPGRTAKAPAGTRDELALASAVKSLVLLKNDGVLPFKQVRRIAVIGPHADATRMLRGNYSNALSGTPISLVDGLRRAMPGAEITLVPFSQSITGGDPVPTSALRTPDGKPGLRAEYFDAAEPAPARFASMQEFGQLSQGMKFSGKPAITRVEPGVAARGSALRGISDHHRVVWTGFLVPPVSGSYLLGLSGFNGELSFEGKVLTARKPGSWGTPTEYVPVTLDQGHRYAIRVTTEVHILSGIDLLWKRVTSDPAAELARAAAQADVIVAGVGLTADLEGEEMRIKVEGFAGGDKTSLDLPSDQRKLLELAKSTGKPLVVVAFNGSPIDLSWAKDNASALIEAWYPGQAGGLALADVLTGKSNPAGRLPLTFYKSVTDLPPFDDYSMHGRTYRYFNGTPVYPFGFGLSYSSFEYAPLTIEPADGKAADGVRVSTVARNTGTRAGEEVAELYLDPPDFDGAPRLALRGFQRMALQPGESRKLVFELSARDLSFVTRDGQRQIFPGEYRVTVGSGQPASGVAFQAATFNRERAVPIPE